MVKTGEIAFVSQSGAGQDEDGNFIAPVDLVSAYIDCNLMTVNKEFKISVDGEYINAKYACYIDKDNISNLGLDLSTISQVKLKNNNGDYIDKFRIGNLEHLNLTKRVKIVV